MARGKIKIIGATTTEEYKRYIEDDKALARRFQTIIVGEPNIEKTKEILLNLKPIYEDFHNVIVKDEIIEMIVDLSNKYRYNRKQPDKAIDILDEVCSQVSIIEDKSIEKINRLNLDLNDIAEKKNNAIISQDFYEAANLRKIEKQLESKILKLEEKYAKNNIPKEVIKENVAEVIKIKTQIPIYEISTDSHKNILKFKDDISKKIKGQNEAIEKLYQIMKRIKLGFKESGKPTSLLFAGPTGVGKTLLVKEFSKYVVGENNLITLDMSEYKEEHTISKIIGSPPGYVGHNNKSTVLEEVKNKPYSVILVDEIEKAHPSVINLFLQILDEGRIKDSIGNVVRFDNTIIVMTSNIGFNKKNIGFQNNVRENILSNINDFLSKEIANRIDEIIIFNLLKEEEIREIIINKLKLIKEKYKVRGVKINISNKVIDEIIEDSKYDDYGARRIDKIIEGKLDNLIIDGLLIGDKKLNIQTIH